MCIRDRIIFALKLGKFLKEINRAGRQLRRLPCSSLWGSVLRIFLPLSTSTIRLRKRKLVRGLSFEEGFRYLIFHGRAGTWNDSRDLLGPRGSRPRSQHIT